MLIKFDKITIDSSEDLTDYVGSAKLEIDVDTEEDLADLSKETTIEKATIDILLKKVTPADYATLRGKINSEVDVVLENNNAVDGSLIATISDVKIYPKIMGETGKTLEVQITRDKRFGTEDYSSSVTLTTAS